MDEPVKHRPLDKYKVIIAGRTYIEYAYGILDDGTIVLNIFGPKYFETGEYEIVNGYSPKEG